MPQRANSDQNARAQSSSAGELRAILISLPAVAIPVAGAFLFPEGWSDYEALLWLLALIPAFLLAYHRGWRGAATMLAFGMAILSVTYYATQALGHTVPRLLWGVVTFYIGITLGIGWLAERVSRKNFDAAAGAVALRDPLTELPNRRYAEVHLEQEFAAAERGRLLAIVLFDFDNFHEFNATHGRAAGDGVLRGFANLLRQTTRRMNVSARYGPEEFICILGTCDEDGALTFAARIQERLRAAESTVTLPTVSVGIAVYRPGVDTPKHILSSAEDALLLAKRAGRDRVRVWNREVDGESQAELQNAERELALAQQQLNQMRIDVRSAIEPIGTGRSTCVIVGDTGERTRLARWLESERFLVVEAKSMADAVQALQAEHDVVFIELEQAGAALTDLIGEVRMTSETTRIVGVPRAAINGSIPPELLAVRVDGHYIPSTDPSSFRNALADLLVERDRIMNTQMRQKQLADEVRAKEREGKVALAASEARYRNVIETIQQVVFTTDSEGRWTFVNSAWMTITGHGIQDTIGRPFWDYLHPDEREEVRASFISLVQRNNTYYRHEGRWRTRGDSYRWMESRFQVSLTTAGEIDGATGVLTDVTDRRRAEDALRRSEEYFRSLIENSADMIAVVNADETVRYVSPSVARELGYPAERWAELEAVSVVHPDDRANVRSRFAELLLEDHGSVITHELRIRHAGGGWRTIEITMRNQLATVGVEGIVVNARDVTDRRNTEAALRESEEMLQRSHRIEAIGRLAGGVAHDFNNLLTSIQGHASLLLDQTTVTPAIHADVEEIRDAAVRATSLTAQLLAFSRRQVLRPRVLQVNAVLFEMDKMLRRLIGDNITLETDLADDIGVVRADPAQLEQVIVNLVVNSRDAMPRGGRIILRSANRNVAMDIVNATSELPAGPYVMVQIEDDGPGMAEAVADHAFEPFYTTKEPGQGTGLGLSTVYGIVKQSGGHVWLETKPDSGTVVTLYLPRVAARDFVVDTTPQTPASGVVRGTETVLLVEDEPSVRELAKRILDLHGYSVITAANGQEALDRLVERGTGVDLVLSDCVMPVMDGPDLADRLAISNPGTRVLLMSGYAEDMVMRQGELGEGRAFIPKPFSPNQLLLKVREVIDAGR
ncbi:MAG: PAS domain S-box protein [Longimicrobiales bacterium]